MNTLNYFYKNSNVSIFKYFILFIEEKNYTYIPRKLPTSPFKFSLFSYAKEWF
jgi:hypothetical protein